MIPFASVLLGASQPAQPINLVATPVGDEIRLQVIGFSAEPLNARFQLLAEGGGNRSVQGGAARLSAGQSSTLIELTLGRAARADWKARLEVRLESGESYVQSYQAE